MSNPEDPAGTQVDPSEDALDEGAGQPSLRAAHAEDEESSMLEVDPSEGPAE
jgi:hypothetical protein